MIKTWALYNNDNNGDLVASNHWRRRGRYAEGTTNRLHLPWVWGTTHPNTAGMIDKSLLLDQKLAAFAPYLRKAEVYRCPSKTRVVVAVRRFAALRELCWQG